MLARRLPLAVVDQLAASGSSFVVGLLVARSETRAGFGTFALAYSTLLLANSMLMATVIKPFIALEDRTDSVSVRGRVGVYLSMQLVLSMIMSVTIAVGGVLSGTGPMFLALGVAIVPVHALELMRRAFFQRLAVTQALRYNLLFAVVNVTGLVVLAWLGRLNGMSAFLVMGASATLAAVAAAHVLCVRPEVSSSAIRFETRRAWAFTRWSAPVTFVESLEARGYSYLSAAMLGVVAPAVLEVGRAMLAPTNILVFPVGNLGMPRVSHYSSTGALGQVRRIVIQAVLIVALGVGAYVGAVWLFAEPMLTLLYGGRYDDVGSIVRTLAAAYFVVCLSGIVGVCLEGMGSPRHVFVAQMWGGLAGLASAWLLLPAIGLTGVAGGMAIGAAVALSVKAVALRRQLADRHSASVPGVTASNI
jgi:O-antigen/teichoic acid export membrane protein